MARRALPDNEIPENLLFGPIDFSVNMSDRIRQLKASHLWLRPRDTDWHRPIVVTLREILQKNWRKRTPEKEEIRTAKKEKSLAKRKAKGASWQQIKRERRQQREEEQSQSSKGKSKGSQTYRSWQRTWDTPQPQTEDAGWGSSWSWWTPSWWTGSWWS